MNPKERLKVNTEPKKVHELKVGDKFKFTLLHSIFNEVKSTQLIEKGEVFKNPPASHIGKYLIVTTSCRQLIMAPETEIHIKI